MIFECVLSYDEFVEETAEDGLEPAAVVEAHGFIRGSHGRHGHPDDWEPPTCNDVEELFVYVDGVDVVNNLTQNAIDRLKEKAWGLYGGERGIYDY